MIPLVLYLRSRTLEVKMLEAYHEFIQSFYSWGRALRAAEMLHSDGLSFLFRLMTILKARVSCGVVEQQRSCVPLV
jgi:hypothetical protein